MPRFFFNTLAEPFLDPEGAEFPDLAAALVEAEVSARQMMADELRHGPLTLGRHLTITAEDGQVLATVAFADCLFRASQSVRTHGSNNNYVRKWRLADVMKTAVIRHSSAWNSSNWRYRANPD